MKVAINVIIWLVGSLFIFSGLIKLNDPVGTEIKLEEYFDVFADDFRNKVVVNGELKSSEDTAMSDFFQALKPFSLSLAILMSALEVIWGFSLLIRFRPRFTLWALFLLVLFFTGLTFYSWYFNKVTDCGCFGDAIKLAPFQSFMKDVILVVLIGFLLSQSKKILPNEQKWAWASNLAVSLLSFGAGIYAAYYLPFIDFMPYKVGNHIPTLMKPTEPLRYEQKYTFLNLETKKEEVFSEQEVNEKNIWEDTLKYEYKAFENKLLNPKAQAKIGADFMWVDADTTAMKKMFQGSWLLLISADLRKSNLKTFSEIKPLFASLKDTKIVPMGLTSDKNTFEMLCHEYQIPIEHHSMDSKILKAMIRTNPGLILLQDGTVKGKWSYKKLPTKDELMRLVKS